MSRPSRHALRACLLFAARAFAAPPGPNTAPGAPAPAKPAPAPASYQGHGAESLAPAVLEKYRPRPLPPEVSCRIQSLFDVRAPGAGIVAPDGKSLYFNWAVTGVTQVWKADGPRRFPVELTGGEDATLLLAITPDGRHLVVARDRKGEENPGLYLQDPAGGPLTVIQHKPGVQTQLQYVSDDGRSIYYRANDVKKDSYAIYRWDVAEKRAELVFGEEGLWTLQDRAPDGKLLLAKETGSLSSEWYEWDPQKRALQPLFGQNEKEEYDAAYGARGEILVVTNEPSDFRRLYRFAAGKLEPISPELKFDVTDLRVDRKREHVFYQTNEAGFFRLHALDARTKKPLALPKLPDADNVYAGPTTPDGRFTTVSVDDGRHPAQPFVIDWRTRRAEPWVVASTPEIDTTKFARAVAETYPARDGTRIPVLVRRPDACEGKLCPVVVVFHGGPEGESRPGFNVSAQMFVDAGFIYVEPNVRGSEGFGKAWGRADDGPKRLDIITDIEDATRWARERFAVAGKPPKLGIYGGSYGGYSCLMGMTRFAGAYDAGVDIVGISNLVTFLKNTAPYRRILRISEYGDPDKDAAALAKLSPMTYVDRVKAPLLILQGASDPRVPAGEAVQIHDALAKRGVPTELMIFPDEGHGAQKRENRVIMFGHAVAYFQKYLR
jgi:dipeptidyl aminopeptidase/acylaminoacyl peptidase